MASLVLLALAGHSEGIAGHSEGVAGIASIARARWYRWYRLPSHSLVSLAFALAGIAGIACLRTRWYRLPSHSLVSLAFTLAGIACLALAGIACLALTGIACLVHMTVKLQTKHFWLRVSAANPKELTRPDLTLGGAESTCNSRDLGGDPGGAAGHSRRTDLQLVTSNSRGRAGGSRAWKLRIFFLDRREFRALSKDPKITSIGQLGGPVHRREVRGHTWPPGPVRSLQPTLPTLNNFSSSWCMKVIFTSLKSPVNSLHKDLKISLMRLLEVGAHGWEVSGYLAGRVLQPHIPILNNFGGSWRMKMIFRSLKNPVNSPHRHLKISLMWSLKVGGHGWEVRWPSNWTPHSPPWITLVFQGAWRWFLDRWKAQWILHTGI